MNLGMLDLHGRVRAYSGGKLLWDRPNKITTLGRKALLAAMARKSEIEYKPDESWFYGLNSDWKFHNKSWISCYAFGNGGALTEQNVVIPAASSMKDMNLFHIVPLRKRLESGYSSSYNLSNYVALPPNAELPIGDGGSQGNKYTLDRTPVLGPETEFISRPDPDNYVYFKILESVDMGIKEIHSTSSSTIDQNSSRIGIHSFETAVARFRLTISAEDLTRVFPEIATEADKARIARDSKVNELSLYMACIENPESEIQYGPKKFARSEDGIYYTLPIQFSHITFPTENFFGNLTKDLDLEYYVFA
jgi:hypothetical protein